MPRSLQDILDHADELAAQAENTGPTGDSHTQTIASLRAAVVAAAAAERAVAHAVDAARSDGLSWTAIGLIVGMSGEAARKRFGPFTAAATEDVALVR